MQIIIDADFLTKPYVPGAALYINELLLQMAAHHPTHSFIYVTHTPLAIGTIAANVQVHYIKKYPVAWPWLTNRLLRGTLKKLQAGLFITVGLANSSSWPVPSCIFLLPGANGLYKAAALQKAHLLFAASAYEKQSVAAQYSIPPEKIYVLPPGKNNNMNALTDTKKEAVKLKYAQGLEYFLFAGDIGEQHRLLELLQAFAQFKKWQQSNMQFIIAGNPTGWTAGLQQKTASFRYRTDVHILPGCPTETLQVLTAAAYAFVYPAPEGHYPYGVIWAMQAGVPVITSGTAVLKELAGNAVLHALPDNAKGFAAGMQLLYKDETLRNEMIKKAKQHIRQAAENGIAAICWQIMMQSLQR